MATGLVQLPLRRSRLTPGALYALGTTVFALLLLVLTGAGLMDPAAVALAGVPLGPLGVVAAALALPALGTAPTPAVGALVLAAVLAIAAVNVVAVAVVSAVASGRPVLQR